MNAMQDPKPKLLIVDDDSTIRLLLSKTLDKIGDVEQAENGEKAVELYTLALQANHPHDLIFLDIMMPGMSGHDVLKKIRESENSHGIVPGEGAKVIMVTTSDDENNIFESHILGCEGYIIKPFSQTQIKEKLLELGFWSE